jgi:hypothetical protein
MSKLVRITLVGAFVTVGVGRAEEDGRKQIEAARKDLLALVKLAEDGKDFSAGAKAIRKKYDLEQVFQAAYRARSKGGIGYGPKARFDGTEQALVRFTKRALSQEQFKAEQAELVRLAHLNVVMAEILEPERLAGPAGGRAAAEWRLNTREMRKAARELLDAARRQNAGRAWKAAGALNNSCNACHTDGRD